MDTSSIKTLNRLVQVLDSFTPVQRTWTLAALAVHLNTPASTLHRLLIGLERHGILRRDPTDKRWRLGYRLVVWGALAEESTTLSYLAGPILQELVDVTGETALLTVYQSGEVICIAMVASPQAVQLRTSIGTPRPAHAGASSKVLLAHLPKGEAERIVCERGLPKLAGNTITEWPALQAELKRIVDQGFAFSSNETDPGAWGIATPIRDWRGEVVAAIGVAGPEARYTEDKAAEYVQLCRKAADQVSGLMRAGSPEGLAVVARGR